MVVLAQHRIHVLALPVGREVFVRHVSFCQVSRMRDTMSSSLNHYLTYSLLEHFSAVCSSACQNNGTCSAPNTCTCTSSWSGATCTTRMFYSFWMMSDRLILIVLIVAVCSPTCSNGGTCSSPGVCTCTSTWLGSRCTTRE